MADETDNGSFESRLGRALDSIDEASRKLEGSIKEKLDRKRESKDSVSRDEEGVLESSNSGNNETIVINLYGFNCSASY